MHTSTRGHTDNKRRLASPEVSTSLPAWIQASDHTRTPRTHVIQTTSEGLLRPRFPHRCIYVAAFISERTRTYHCKHIVAFTVLHHFACASLPENRRLASHASHIFLQAQSPRDARPLAHPRASRSSLLCVCNTSKFVVKRPVFLMVKRRAFLTFRVSSAEPTGTTCHRPPSHLQQALERFGCGVERLAALGEL